MLPPPTGLNTVGKDLEDDGEDGAEKASDETNGAVDVAGAGSDLAKDDLDIGDEVELGNNGEGEVDDGSGDGNNDAQAGLDVDVDLGEDG